MKKLIPLPKPKKPTHNFNEDYYRKIGKAGYSSDRIIRDNETVEFEVERLH